MLNFGIVGMSEGNGHPYSWSAIFNGYDAELMEQCDFPIIPRYLEKQSWPDDCIHEAKITHIWTQNKELSHLIAKTTYIDNVVEELEDMIGQVDAILLARDDAENHLSMSAPFLAAGLPIYIDKPICLSLYELEKFYHLQKYPGQIFSCSALRYAKELILTESQREAIGKINYIHATVPKDWDRYSVHVIEPMLLLVGEQGKLVSSNKVVWKKFSETYYVWESGFHATVSAMESMISPINLRIFGEEGFQDLFFLDTFSAFKLALKDFTESVFKKDERISYDFSKKIVNMIEQGSAARGNCD